MSLHANAWLCMAQRMNAVSLPSLTKEIRLAEIKPFISRARGEEGFKGLKDSIKQHGVLQPIQVRDLGRKDKDGHRYELICGEGRMTACKQLRMETIPALIIEAPTVEIAGRFMAENLMRKSLPWAQKGRMIRELMKGGMEIGDVAKKLSIGEPLARKYLSILDRQASEDVEQLTVNDAEKLVTMPARDQKIIMEFVKETGQNVQAVVEKVKQVKVKEGEGWTKAALQKAMRADDDALKKQREVLTLKRLHQALGPGNLRKLMAQSAFVREAKALGLNLTHFQQ